MCVCVSLFSSHAMSTSAFCSREYESLLAVFGEIAKLSAKYVSEHYKSDTKVIEFLTPEELKKHINLSLPEEGTPITENLEGTENAVLVLNPTTDRLRGLRECIEKILKHSVRTGSPRYFNQLWSGTDVASIVGEWITAVTNASTYTYEVAPVYSLMELELCSHLRRLIGWQDGDGVLAPGGALCNLMGMLCARSMHSPDTAKAGVQGGKRLVSFTSVHSHYTIKRSAMLLGLGSDSVVEVGVDSTGHMDPARLEAAVLVSLAAGDQPFFVNVTSGSTVLGTFDPIQPIADICERFGLWLHVDGALGASVLLSRKHKHLMSGVERADSVTWCLHKLMGISQQCSAFLTKTPDLLKRTNASKAAYLFHTHDEAPYDLGDKTLNCGRRQDALKAWLSWKVHGDEGFGRRLEHGFALAKYCAREIERREGRFELLFEPECVQDGPERDALLDEATRTLRRAMQEEGQILVNYNPLPASPPLFRGLPNFFRIVFSNPEQTERDVLLVLDTMERLGESLALPAGSGEHGNV